jgi:hypothetical protein
MFAGSVLFCVGLDEGVGTVGNATALYIALLRVSWISAVVTK